MSRLNEQHVAISLQFSGVQTEPKRLTSMLRTCNSMARMEDLITRFADQMDATHLSVALHQLQNIAKRSTHKSKVTTVGR